MLSEWILKPELIHLNHAAVGPWPVRTQIAIEAFANENARQGSLNYPQWIKTEAALKNNLARMINAPGEETIALLKNTSEALSLVAYGLDFKKNDHIVISDQEFPSNRIIWESLSRSGVIVSQVDLTNADTPEQALINACNKNTRLLSISSVQFATGLKINLEVLGNYCEQNDILFCVDAIQSAGAEALDVQRCKIDFLAADGHKWLLAPEGLAVFYCRKELLERLTLLQYGWHMMENLGDFNAKTWTPARTARRFECGSPNMLGIHALNASTSLLLESGLSDVKYLIESKINYLFDELQDVSHLRIITPDNPHQRLGIFSFYSEKFSSEYLFNTMQQHGVFCALRNNWIRFSPHYYTPTEQISRVVELIKEL